MKTRTRRLLSLLLCLMLLYAAVIPVAAVDIRPGDTPTRENVLEVLQTYDPEGGYYVLRATEDYGDFMMWFGGSYIMNDIETAVHEEYHGLQTYGASYGYSMIYLDAETSYEYSHSAENLVKTEEMAQHIPPELQTFRYETYVAPGAVVTANLRGAYGLMREFSAYYYGLRTMNRLVPFLWDTDADADCWFDYVLSIPNNMNAYAEFKYWTLRYMDYVRTAYPSLYDEILANTAYCQAYRAVDTRFAEEIRLAQELVAASKDQLSRKGLSVKWTDSGIWLWQGSSGRGTDLDDYNTLMAELEKPEYLEMDRALKQAAGEDPSGKQNPFTDVSDGDFFKDAVIWAVGQGVTSGTSATTFEPNGSCTRGQAVTFLWRANGSPRVSGSNPFTDVAVGSYYYDAVLWAVSRGITKGTSETTFSPDAACSRGEIVAFLHRAAGSPTASGTLFGDVTADAYYAASVQWAVREGITMGTGPTTFSPGQTCTRGQIVTFIYRQMSRQ